MHTHMRSQIHTRAHARNVMHTYIHTHTFVYKQYGHTALYLAAFNRCEDVVELLLGAKADPDLTDRVI